MTQYEKSASTLELPAILAMLAHHAVSDEAKARAAALSPSTDAATVQRLLAETSAARGMMVKRGSPSFSGVKDVRASLSRADMGGTLNIRELMDIAGVLTAARMARTYAAGDGRGNEKTCIDGLFNSLITNRFLEDKITGSIAAEDELSDAASPELASIRRLIRAASARVREALQKIISSPSYSKALQDPIITTRSERYVVPVKAEFKNTVPGLVHDVSASGATLFIEPMAAVKANNELRELRAREKAEVERILAELSADCAEHADDISRDFGILVSLDLIFAKAKLSYAYDGMEPEISERAVVLRKARHPLLPKDTAVPIDLALGGDYDTLVITGPNTGGKTVTLKTIGLMCVMAACGLHLPVADGSCVPVFRAVLADIGDEQSIEQNLSTFSSHMTNIVRILNECGPNTLILFDELGGGTDPIEGAALAIAILSHLNDMGVRCMATTHYSELKTFAMSTPGVENASCEFDVATLQPTYKLMIGIPGKSNAFAIAKKLGIDDSIIESAKANIDSDTVDFETLIADLERSKREIEQDKADIARLKEDAKQLQERAQMKDTELSDKKAEILAKARQEASEIIEEAKAEADAAIRKYNKWTTNPAKADAKAMEAERQKLRAKINDLGRMNEEKRKTVKSDHKASDFKVGDTVHVISMDSEGTIMALADSKGKLKVQMGIISAALPPTDLLLVEHEKKKPQKATVTGGKSMNRMMNIKPEINVLGMTVDEATSLVDRFLDDALMAHLHRVTIIHGKGTGALRKGIHQFLKSQPHVKSFRLGEFGEGDAGVTIVEL